MGDHRPWGLGVISVSLLIGFGKAVYEARKEQGMLTSALISCQRQFCSMERAVSDYYHLMHERERERQFLVDCLKSGNTEAAIAHLGGTYETTLTPLFFTGKACLDLLLTRWTQEMKKEEIALSLSVQIFSLPIPEGELCVLLDNLLENAREAAVRCEGRRWARMMWIQQEEMHRIVIENGCSRMPVIRNGHIQSDKQGKNHGWGLKTVAGIVKHYGGEETLHAENERFSVSIIFWTER